MISFVYRKTMPNPPNSFLKEFFLPLQESPKSQYVSFPGFGFWDRIYAETIANITQEPQYSDALRSQSALCDFITLITDQNPAQCPPFWDDLSCFPATEVGQLSVIPCPSFIINVPYDTSRKYHKNTLKIVS